MKKDFKMLPTCCTNDEVRIHDFTRGQVNTHRKFTISHSLILHISLRIAYFFYGCLIFDLNVPFCWRRIGPVKLPL